MTIGFSKIMVGIDGSEESLNAADYAIAIANKYNAELIAIHGQVTYLRSIKETK
jgi:nucleotide-binding universal stress UspA family protein